MKSIAITLLVIALTTCFDVPSQKAVVTELECDTTSCYLPKIAENDTNRLDRKLRILDTMLKEKECKKQSKKKPQTKL